MLFLLGFGERGLFGSFELSCGGGFLVFLLFVFCLLGFLTSTVKLM